MLAAAAAKSLQSCPTLCDPIDSSPPGSPSLGLSRQEHWSGLPFPSPMHESEKWKWSRSVVSDSSRPHGLQPTKLFCPWDFPGKSTGVGCHCLPCMCAYSLWLFPSLCDSMDHSQPDSSVHGIFQARMLECIAMPSSRWNMVHSVKFEFQIKNEFSYVCLFTVYLFPWLHWTYSYSKIIWQVWQL